MKRCKNCGIEMDVECPDCGAMTCPECGNGCQCDEDDETGNDRDEGGE